MERASSLPPQGNPFWSQRASEAWAQAWRRPVDVAVPHDQDLEEGAIGALRQGRVSSPGTRRSGFGTLEQGEEFITPEEGLFPPRSWRQLGRSEGPLPVDRRSQGPVPGLERLETEQDAEFQREVEFSMMEHLVEENEKLKAELRGLKEKKDQERNSEMRTEAERYRDYEMRTEAERYRGREKSTEVEGHKRWPEDVPRPCQGTPERVGKRPRRIQRYTPQGTRVPDSPEQAEVKGPEF